MIKVSQLADCSSSAAVSCTGSSRSGQCESPGGSFDVAAKFFVQVKSRMVGFLLEHKVDLPLWGPAYGELARGFSGPWSRSGCCPRCSLQGIVVVPTDLIKKMNKGNLPVPQGYSLPRYLAPSPPVTTVLLPTSMNSVNLKSVKTVMIMIEVVGMLLMWMLMLRMTLSGCTSLLNVILVLVSALVCACLCLSVLVILMDVFVSTMREWEWL